MPDNASDQIYPLKYDLTNCDKEPIHLIRTVQSFACVVAVDLPDYTISQVSDNCILFLGKPHDEVLNQPLSTIFSPYIIELLKTGVEKDDFLAINPIPLPVTADLPKPRIISAHVHENRLLVEVEAILPDQNKLANLNMIDQSVGQMQTAQSLPQLFETLTKEVKKISGYDRVMLYRFDQDYHGEVVAESKEEALEAFYGLRFPATDIPKQARALFIDNRVRMLADVDDELSLIQPAVHPQTGQALYVGSCAARGVSPIHLEYLNNMGVKATLNVAIVEGEKLWGLISCHHYAGSKVLDLKTRNLIKFMGQVISGHLSLFKASTFRGHLLQENIIHSKLFHQMNEQQSIVKGLMDGELTLMDYIPACGAALIYDDKIRILGETPDAEAIASIQNWLRENVNDIIYSTDALIQAFPGSSPFSKKYAGLLAIRLSDSLQEYILWFRKAQVQEVIWGGNPQKAVVPTEDGLRLSPRKSFAQWKERIEDRSLPWEQHLLDAAIKLHNDIKEILLKRFSELKKLNRQLQQSYKELERFSYTVSHDLRSPLRAIDGFAQILLEDYAGKLDSYGLNVVQTIIESTQKMNTFIDKILDLSKLANNKFIFNELDMNKLITRVWQETSSLNEVKTPVKIDIKDLPVAFGDNTLISQLFTNLLSNSLKYTRHKAQPSIEIGGGKQSDYHFYYVKDNGIGFDMKHADKIFDVFSRLVSEDKYEGTGVGLSIVKRIVERHEGTIVVNSIPNEGTTIEIRLPGRMPEGIIN